MKPDSTLTCQNGGVENGVNDSSSTPQNKSSCRIGGLEVEWSEDHGRLSRMGGLSYVTNLEHPAKQIRPLYNPRGDNENCYDEMKNQ